MRSSGVMIRTLFGAALVGWMGCAGGSGQGPATPGNKVTVDEPLPRPAATIERIALRQDGTRTVLEIDARQPLLWTSYRDPDDRLILELTDAQPAAGVADLAAEDGLVASVAITANRPDLATAGPLLAGRSLTRLVITTREDAVHALRPLDAQLRLIFQRPDEALARRGGRPPGARRPRPGAGGRETEATEAKAPTPAAAEVAPPVSPPPATPKPSAAGAPTPPPPPPPLPRPASPPPRVEPSRARPVPSVPAPSEPVPSEPAPSEPAAAAIGTRLERVRYEETGDGLAIRLLGDGPFAYEVLRLDGPPRFVVDLLGVTRDGVAPEIAVAHPSLTRIRTGQFQASPPIARVVLDLADGPVEPVVHRLPRGLLVVVGR